MRPRESHLASVAMHEKRSFTQANRLAQVQTRVLQHNQVLTEAPFVRTLK